MKRAKIVNSGKKAEPVAKCKRAKIVNKGKSAEVWIYDDIGEDWFGGISAKAFAEDLRGLKNVDQITVYINSAGGSVFDGMSIYNQLVRHPAAVNVEIDGLAASIASLIAMSGDSISIAENAMMMIHKPMGGGFGTSEDMRSLADTLDKIQDTLRDTYVARSNADPEKITELIDAETWLSAHEALEYGLVDTVTEAKKIAAFVDVASHNFKNTPEDFPTAIYTVKPEAPNRKKYADVLKAQRQHLQLIKAL